MEFGLWNLELLVVFMILSPSLDISQNYLPTKAPKNQEKRPKSRGTKTAERRKKNQNESRWRWSLSIAMTVFHGLRH